MCDCKKRDRVIQNPKPVVAIVEEREPTQEEINMVDDWYNNIDIIEPIED